MYMLAIFYHIYSHIIYNSHTKNAFASALPAFIFGGHELHVRASGMSFHLCVTWIGGRRSPNSELFYLGFFVCRSQAACSCIADALPPALSVYRSIG